ncbi:MAG TPA: hypothetical protein VNM46_07105, partial [Xanthobacteraceae bacterium]|nr:hypothetical protein [Xanthobacteraceae bacterium]
MSRYAHQLLTGTLLAAAMCGTMPAWAQDNPVLRRFGAGLGLDAVGMVDASEDVEVAGPQAIYAGEGNELYLLDQVNGRVLSFDPSQSNAPTRSFKLPSDLQPTDLIVRRGQILVWDGDVHVLRPTGPDNAPTRGLEITSTRGVDDPFAVSEFAQMGSQKPGSDTDLLNGNTRGLSQPRPPNRQYVTSRVRGPLVATVTPDADKAGAHIEVQAQGQSAPIARLHMKVRDRLGATEVLEVDRQGRIFVLGENIPAIGGEGASAFVARYSQSGALEGIYDLPLSQSVALSRRFVTVSENGDVYFLRTQKASVDVLGVGFRPLRAKVIDVGRHAPSYDLAQGKKKGKGPIVAVGPLTRQRVIETAFAFEGIRWRVNAGAYGRDPDTTCTGFNRVRRPGYLHGKLNQEVRGMPYCWGCHGSLQQIAQKIERGTLAGNWCTHNAPRNDVAGVDCSAFVSATWGLATHFTTAAIPAITRRLENPWDLQPGDALNKPGSHVMLFLRFTADRKAEVIEASTGGCNGRVCRNVYPLASLLARGYAPVRYRALINEAVANVSFPDQQQQHKQRQQQHKKQTKSASGKRGTR